LFKLNQAWYPADMSTHDSIALTEFRLDQHLTYPHSNGFTEGGDALILGQREPGRQFSHPGTISARHEQRVIFTLPPTANSGVSGPLFFDIAREGTSSRTYGTTPLRSLDLDNPKAARSFSTARSSGRKAGESDQHRCAPSRRGAFSGTRRKRENPERFSANRCSRRGILPNA